MIYTRNYSYDIICDDNYQVNTAQKRPPSLLFGSVTTDASLKRLFRCILSTCFFFSLRPRIRIVHQPEKLGRKSGCIRHCFNSRCWQCSQVSRMPARVASRIFLSLRDTLAASQILTITVPPTRESEKQMRRTRDASEHLLDQKLEIAAQTS